jgi:anti-sigma factor RsiW
MTCERFQAWLDDGMPDATAAAHHAHAAGCAECQADLAAARAIETALERVSATAPAALTEHVMLRVRALESARMELLPTTGSLPWWVRAAGEPAAALAFVVAALVLWQRQALMSATAALLLRAGETFASYGATLQAVRIPESFTRPDVALGFSFALAPLLAWGSWRLWRWIER